MRAAGRGPTGCLDIAGQLCDACDEPILANEIEHEVDFENYPTQRFHTTCESIWRALVAQTTPAASEGA